MGVRKGEGIRLGGESGEKESAFSPFARPSRTRGRSRFQGMSIRKEGSLGKSNPWEKEGVLSGDPNPGNPGSVPL